LFVPVANNVGDPRTAANAFLVVGALNRSASAGSPAIPSPHRVQRVRLYRY